MDSLEDICLKMIIRVVFTWRCVSRRVQGYFGPLIQDSHHTYVDNVMHLLKNQ